MEKHSWCNFTHSPWGGTGRLAHEEDGKVAALMATEKMEAKKMSLHCCHEIKQQSRWLQC